MTLKESGMKAASGIFLTIGIIAMIIIPFVDATKYDTYNIGLLSNKQNLLMIACTVTLLGGILFGAGSIYDLIFVIFKEKNKEKQIGESEQKIGILSTASNEQSVINDRKWKCPNCQKINLTSDTETSLSFNNFRYKCSNCHSSFELVSFLS
jgi:hypothetical protein